MSEAITIGVDHGYYAMKTRHFSFPTGLVEYDHEPYTQQDVLEYGGKFYVVGSGRQPLQKDKTATEDYYLLTLAAIARELAHRGAEPTAAVHLAAGLPLTSFGRDKKKFRAYLLRDGKPVSFRYEGIAYTVTITEASLFPQGYAAVLTQQVAGRTLRHRGGHRRLDSGSDAAGQPHPQRRHLPEPRAGHDPLSGRDRGAGAPRPGPVHDGGTDRELSPG